MALALWYVCVFLAGLAAGGLVNLCVSRLPYEKALLWPGPRCDTCVQPIRWFDCLPLVGYLALGGRCRTCRGPIPLRYFLVELGTGLAFVGLFHAEMVENWPDLRLVRQAGRGQQLPREAAVVFAHHATLLSFLIAASVCDLMDMEIPLSLTLAGTLVGLVLAACLPWPAPEPVPTGHPGRFPPYPGAYAWPVWYPLPDWLPAGSWKLGLATGLAGALAGMVVLRAVRFLFTVGRGIEGLGVGDADLMMMAGAFVGWQPVVIAFFVSVFPALLFAVGQILLRGGQTLPFGPSLAAGVLITMLAWPALGRNFELVFFDAVFLGVLAVAGCMALLIISFLLRLLRGGAGA